MTQNQNDNPLMGASGLPFGAPDFDRSRLRNEHFVPALLEALKQARAQIAALRDNAAAPSFENTIEALTFAGQGVERVAHVFEVIAASDSSDEVRDLEEVFDRELAAYHSDVSMDAALFARVKTVYDARASLTLSLEGQTLLEETYKGFVRGGALLADPEKQRMRVLNEEGARLATQFANNDLKATQAYRKIIRDEAELVGVPERAKEFYRRSAKEEGIEDGFLILLEPFPFDIMTHAENRALREEIYRANAVLCCDGAFDNRGVIMDMLRVRFERARLLGFATHADYVLSERMAGSVETVRAFLERNLSVYKPAAQKELEALRAFAKKKDGLEKLQSWDVPYYMRLLKEETFAFEMESVRPYFDLEKVLVGLRQHAEKLFGLRIEEQPAGKYPVYNPDVKVFEVSDEGKVIGLFYADYFARAGAKRGGAWMNAVRDRGLYDGVDCIPIVCNNCNFPKPSPEHPTFLSMNEVETVFHEFGHGLHALLAKAKYPELAGSNVKWDFVELPSQVQENWTSKKEVLDGFARHAETGEPLPAAMVEILQKMRTFDAGTAGLRQTYFGLLDLGFYACDPATIASPEALEKSVESRVLLLPREAGLMACAFGHIFGGGYSAGYYSYKWAEVLDADVFSAFEKNGLYDPETARKLKTLYSKGGTENPMDLFVAMMGRKPDPEALFRREGLAG